MTDAQAIAGVVTNSGAILKAASTAAQKAAVAGAIIDDLIADVDLSTPRKRKLFRLKSGLDEMAQIVEKIAPDTLI
jgi:hypothetical protein